ncbi:unnamed protein product [Brassica rapa]|uniref:Uncharacterized protein n=1 Tax=Brassica campestris TaxID=3711 RepID=A0A8D9M3T0_BRACM|nr:unnamed protein product [Brassica rapa]
MAIREAIHYWSHYRSFSASAIHHQSFSSSSSHYRSFSSSLIHRQSFSLLDCMHVRLLLLFTEQIQNSSSFFPFESKVRINSSSALIIYC